MRSTKMRILQVAAVVLAIASAAVVAGSARAATTITYRDPYQTVRTPTRIETWADFTTGNGGVAGAEIRRQGETAPFASRFEPQTEAHPANSEGDIRATFDNALLPGILPYSGYGARTCFREVSVGTSCGPWRPVMTQVQLTVPTVQGPTFGPLVTHTDQEFQWSERQATFNATLAGPRAAGQLRLETRRSAYGDGSITRHTMNTFSEATRDAASGTATINAATWEPLEWRVCYHSRFTPAPQTWQERVIRPEIDRCTNWQTQNVPS